MYWWVWIEKIHFFFSFNFVDLIHWYAAGEFLYHDVRFCLYESIVNKLKKSIKAHFFSSHNYHSFSLNMLKNNILRLGRWTLSIFLRKKKQYILKVISCFSIRILFILHCCCSKWFICSSRTLLKITQIFIHYKRQKNANEMKYLVTNPPHLLHFINNSLEIYSIKDH